MQPLGSRENSRGAMKVTVTELATRFGHFRPNRVASSVTFCSLRLMLGSREKRGWGAPIPGFDVGSTGETDVEKVHGCHRMPRHEVNPHILSLSATSDSTYLATVSQGSPQYARERTGSRWRSCRVAENIRSMRPSEPFGGDFFKAVICRSPSPSMLATMTVQKRTLAPRTRGCCLTESKEATVPPFGGHTFSVRNMCFF